MNVKLYWTYKFLAMWVNVSVEANFDFGKVNWSEGTKEH